MRLSEARGRLVVIGGGEDKGGDCEILKEFVRLARGARARIVVMTVATDEPLEAGGEYRDVFRRLGVDDVKIVDVSAREDAKAEEALKTLKAATGIFFTGGDQLHITTLVGGTVMHEVLKERFEKGVAPDESEALRGELERIERGEIVVFFYDRLEPLVAALRQYGATPAEAIEPLAVGAIVAQA